MLIGLGAYDIGANDSISVNREIDIRGGSEMGSLDKQLRAVRIQLTEVDSQIKNLASQKRSYAARLRTPYSLRELKDTALKGIGVVMLIVGGAGVMFGLGRIAVARDNEANHFMVRSHTKLVQFFDI